MALWTLGTHTGEIEVQERLGVHQSAGHATRLLKREIPAVAQEFLRDQPWVIVSAQTAEGAVWIAQITASPGFLEVPGPQYLRIAAQPWAEDPITQALYPGAALGLLALDPQTRRRLRINGRIESCDGGIMLHTEQVYANCPKYIQARRWTLTARVAEPEVTRGTELTEHQQRWIAMADTFFIGSVHPQAGADASHRGGNPGFIEVCDARTLRWPDYVGNNLFNTLGNISVDARVGLLFVDYESGHMLQLNGSAIVSWETADTVRYPGAQRLIEFTLTQIVETRHASLLAWALLERSPFNP